MNNRKYSIWIKYIDGSDLVVGIKAKHSRHAFDIVVEALSEGLGSREFVIFDSFAINPYNVKEVSEMDASDE